MREKILSVLVFATVMSLGACQSLRPHAQGLPTLVQVQQQVALKQDQVDIRWKDQSFSFLLYQQQQADYLQILALSVSGQILFELHYDGEKLKTVQTIKEMRYLPFDFLMRDIFWGTLSSEIVGRQVQGLGLSLEQYVQDSEIHRIIVDNKQNKLQILIQDKKVTIDNLTVPYQLTLYPSQQDFFQPQ